MGCTIGVYVLCCLCIYGKYQSISCTTWERNNTLLHQRHLPWLHRTTALRRVWRKGWPNSWFHGSPTASSFDDDDDDLDTPATTAAVKINKTWNKLQIDFFSLSIFAFYILLQARRPSIWHSTGHEPNRRIAGPRSFRFSRGRRRHSPRTHKLQSFLSDSITRVNPLLVAVL